ncbi:hypothetical protein B0H11DRAFT_2183036 [Mycena galericulata]|nr:hypothetical protein B0H11DRAFT_2183036 [Mycena galericulata]
MDDVGGTRRRSIILLIIAGACLREHAVDRDNAADNVFVWSEFPRTFGESANGKKSRRKWVRGSGGRQGICVAKCRVQIKRNCKLSSTRQDITVGGVEFERRRRDTCMCNDSRSRCRAGGRVPDRQMSRYVSGEGSKRQVRRPVLVQAVAEAMPIDRLPAEASRARASGGFQRPQMRWEERRRYGECRDIAVCGITCKVARLPDQRNRMRSVLTFAPDGVKIKDFD